MNKILSVLLLSAISFCGFSQSQKQYDAFGGTASGTNSYSVTIDAITSNVPYNGQKIWVKFTNANTTTSTLKVNGMSAVTINLNGAVLTSGDIPAAAVYDFRYNSSTTRWDMLQSGLTRGTNTYSANTSFNNTGTFKIAPTSTFSLVVGGASTFSITGAATHTYAGGLTKNVTGSYHMTITNAGTSTWSSSGNLVFNTTGSATRAETTAGLRTMTNSAGFTNNTTGNIIETATGNFSRTITGTHTIAGTGNYDFRINGNKYIMTVTSTTGDANENIFRDFSSNADGQYNIAGLEGVAVFGGAGLTSNFQIASDGSGSITAGAFSESFAGFSFGASGNSLYNYTGDFDMTVNTNKYVRNISAVGDGSETYFGSYSLTAANSGFSSVIGATGDATISSAGTYSVGAGTLINLNGNLKFPSAGTPGANRVLTSDANGNATWQGSVVYTTTVSLTSAQIKTLNSEPVTIVAAPGAGYAIEAISTSAKSNFVSVAFTNTTLFLTENAGVGYQQNSGSTFLSTTSTIFTRLSSAAVLNVTQVVENAALKAYASADSAVGDGNVVLYVAYRIIPL